MKTIILTCNVFVVLILCSCKKENSTTQIDITNDIPSVGMYVSTQFDDASISKHLNIIYSVRSNYRNNQYTSINTKAAEMASDTLRMRMDIAVPPNATITKRQPLIIFIHGGGFVTGDKGDMTSQALSYAKAGYVVASINYRLTQNQTNDTSRLLSRIHALEDAGNAIRYLKANQHLYYIDTNRILTLGSSAGGGLSLVNAIEVDASTSISNYNNISSRCKGAIATGATLSLNDLNGITLTYDATDMPVLMFHANPIDSGTGATWQDALQTQQTINASGNSCTLYPQPNMTHTVPLDLGGNYWPQLKPFIWKTLNLASLL